MKCPNCNLEVSNDSRFCERCGAKIKTGRSNRWILILLIACTVVIAGFYLYLNQKEQTCPGEKEENTVDQTRDFTSEQIESKSSTILEENQPSNAKKEEENFTNMGVGKKQNPQSKNNTPIKPTTGDYPTPCDNTSAENTKPVTHGSHTLEYGTWTGDLKNNQPDGTGTMTYKVTHRIDPRDVKERVAEAGDYIIGEFSQGKLVHGVWYDKYNNQKGRVIIGK